MKSQGREVQQIIRNLQRLGWSVHETQSNHYKATSPNKDIPLIIIPKTPSDHRALKNLKALLRRYKVFI